MPSAAASLVDLSDLRLDRHPKERVELARPSDERRPAVLADVDAANPGYEFYGAEQRRELGQFLYSAKDGKLLWGGLRIGWIAALALSIGLAGWLNAVQLWWYLRRAAVYAVQPGWARFLRQLLLASLAMVAVVLAILSAWDQWTTWPWWQRLWRLLAMVGAGGAAYLAALFVQGIRPADLRH